MRVKHDDHYHEITLLDSGTLDTEVEVDGIAMAYSQEYAEPYRTTDGRMTAAGLRRMACDACDDDCLP